MIVPQHEEHSYRPEDVNDTANRPVCNANFHIHSFLSTGDSYEPSVLGAKNRCLQSLHWCMRIQILLPKSISARFSPPSTSSVFVE